MCSRRFFYLFFFLFSGGETQIKRKGEEEGEPAESFQK
jgi:hypothetical protein